MSLYVNNKQYTSNIVIDRGLTNVNITDNDIRPGKVSIDSKGNKLNSLSTTAFLSKYTYDATVTATDITEGKSAYSNGVKIIGTAQSNTDTSNLIKGVKRNYIIANNVTIYAGDFVVKNADNTITQYQINSTILGIALQSGQSGDEIEVVSVI